jgi:hypothetical protein
MRTDGALAAVIGTVVGAVVLAGVGMTALLIPCDSRGLECLGPAVIAFVAASAGFVLGSLVGCYLALRIRGHEAAGATIGILALLGLVAAGICGLLAAAGAPERSFLPVGAAAWLGLPVLARLIVRSRRSRGTVEI